MRESEEVGLFHNPNELLLIDLPVPVAIGLIDHLLQLLISHGLAQFSGNSLQIFEGNLASAVIVEESEGLEDLLSGVSLRNLASHEFHEVGELDHSLSLTVDLSNHLFHFFLFWLKTKSSHGDLQFLSIDVS